MIKEDLKSKKPKIIDWQLEAINSSKFNSSLLTLLSIFPLIIFVILLAKWLSIPFVLAISIFSFLIALVSYYQLKTILFELEKIDNSLVRISVNVEQYSKKTMVRSLELGSDSDLKAHRGFQYRRKNTWVVNFRNEKNNSYEILWCFSTQEKAEQAIMKILNFSSSPLESLIIVKDKSLHFTTYLLFSLSVICLILWFI